MLAQLVQPSSTASAAKPRERASTPMARFFSARVARVSSVSSGGLSTVSKPRSSSARKIDCLPAPDSPVTSTICCLGGGYSCAEGARELGDAPAGGFERQGSALGAEAKAGSSVISGRSERGWRRGGQALGLHPAG